MAPTFTAIFMPSEVPLEIAVRKLFPRRSLGIDTNSGIFSICGNIILAMTTAPGAAITDAANRLLANSKRWTGSFPPRKPM